MLVIYIRSHKIHIIWSKEIILTKYKENIIYLTNHSLIILNYNILENIALDYLTFVITKFM